MKRITLFGFEFISATDHSGILEELRSGEYRNGSDLPMLITPNVDQVVKCNKPEYALLFSRLKKAKYILPDGQPIVWVSRLRKGPSLASRLTGSDFFPLFWDQVIQDRSKLGLFLSYERVGQRLQTEYPRCHYAVAGNIDPDSEQSIQEAVELCVAVIEKQESTFFGLGIGFPKQELVALELIKTLKTRNIPVPLMLLLGASFEFYVGEKKRSPKVLQNLGLEFAHRMFSEPRRMFKRYIIEDSKFFSLAARELLQ